jgi:hypothetical protein
MKIGITISLETVTESIWTNGIKLNILYLIETLKKSKKNYEIYLLNMKNIEIPENLPTHFNGINLKYFNDVYEEMDLLIAMGSQVYSSQIKKFKSHPNKKFISYKCGNNYVLTTEKILFTSGFTTTEYTNEQDYDEVWYVPQQHETNYGYYKTFHRTNAIQVPFLWHYKFLKNSLTEISNGYKNEKYKKNWQYDIGKKKKTIGIMEPNLNIVKFCLIPLFIVEESYRGKQKDNIDSVLIANGLSINKKQNFISLIKNLDLYRDKKISVESRYQTAYFLTQHIDILVSHQILNPLNYLYLDAAYMGYPIIHNAKLCKDLGYYYEDSNTEEGKKLLDYVLTEHDNNIDEYDKRNDIVLQRYFAENEEIVNQYDLLIENLFNNTPNTYLKYNPDTNLLESKF